MAWIRTSRALALGLAAVLGVGAAVCSVDDARRTDDILQSSDRLRGDEAPEVGEPARDALVDANNAFAVDLFDQLRRQNEGNLFCSPVSISMAMAMIYAGARGETAEELASAMHFELPQEELHPAFGWLDVELGSRGRDAAGQGGSEPFVLSLSNSVWGQEGIPYEPEFLDVLAASYDTGIHLVDFEREPSREAARSSINDWTSEATEGRIQEIIPPGAFDAYTRLVLVNAIYFTAAWASQFEDGATIDRRFTTLSGDEVLVPTMGQTGVFPYVAGQGFQAIELPYEGHEAAMVVLLPDAGAYEPFEESLAEPGRVEGILDAVDRASGETVVLRLPEFGIETPPMNLNQVLSSLGVDTAFRDGEADFSGITETPLRLDRVIHRATVSVDEGGTEAAAATAVIAADADADIDADVETIYFYVDRPFLFLIRDRLTGSILFLGRVLDPAP